MTRPTCVDLFSGCGGFSLGMKRAGFVVLAAIDNDPHAVSVFKRNFPEVRHSLCLDLTQLDPAALGAIIGRREVDVIVGGPPCQGFSTVRQRDGSNSGKRMIDDDRRYLYRHFLRFVAYFKPKVFVMENVLGIQSAAGGEFFVRVQEEARLLGYRVHTLVERANDLGVPQKRVRQLIVGTNSSVPLFMRGGLVPVARAGAWPTLGEAIGDLPPLQAGQGVEETAYEMQLRKAHVVKYGRRYLFDILEADKAKCLTAHRARPHSARDLRDFQRLREGEHCAEAMKRGEKFEFPYSRVTFLDRYKRQHRNEPCSTIVAHLSKDGLMFVHPVQLRSLTPREAARIQSFPDHFLFPVSRTHQFRLIGNAVPPLVAEAVGEKVKKFLASVHRGALRTTKGCVLSKSVAQRNVAVLSEAAANGTLRNLSKEVFTQGWQSLFVLLPQCHPDVELSVKNKKSKASAQNRAKGGTFSETDGGQSCGGWPVSVIPIILEARRRLSNGMLKEREYYCDGHLPAVKTHRR